jgi:hypothetical protein
MIIKLSYTYNPLRKFFPSSKEKGLSKESRGKTLILYRKPFSSKDGKKHIEGFASYISA